MRRAFLVTVAAALCVPTLALAAWPLPPTAPPEEHADRGNWPSDPQYAASDWLWSHTSDGIGASVDRAHSVTRGSPSVVIAVLGAGVDWESKDLVNKWALSRGELPPPQNAAGSTANGPDPHDRNGDGRFNMQDYTSATGTALPVPSLVVDPRLDARTDNGDVNGNGLLDPEDLLAIFGDGVDEDGNGRADDICGYDFAMNDANARAETPVSDTAAAEIAAAQTNDAAGRAGACPECLVLPLRISFADISSPSELARALRLLTSRVALINAPPFAMSDELLSAASQSTALIISAPALRPGVRLEPMDALPAVLRAEPIDAQRSRPAWAPKPLTTSLLSPPSSAAGATLAGIAGLLTSLGSLDPARVRAVLLDSATSGRVHARRAVDAVNAGRIPPALSVSAPEGLAHLEARPFQVRGVLSSSTASTLVLEAAPGVEPSAFTLISTIDAGTSFDGVVGTVDPGALSLPPPLLRDDPFGSALTVRVRAESTLADGGVVSAEAKQSVFLSLDRQLRPFFPLAIPGAGAAAPKLVDINADGSDDLLVATSDGKLFAFDDRGAALPGFPVQLDGGGISAPPAVADLGFDAVRDVAVVTESGQLARFDGLGQLAPGFPIWLDCGGDGGCPATRAYAAPVLATSPLGGLIVQGDAHGHVHVFLENGSELAGSPLTVGSLASPIVATPAVGDVDDDGWPDIIVGTAELSPSASSTRVRRLAINEQGVAEVPSFDVSLPVAMATGPELLRRGVIASPLIANLDRQGRRELLVRSTGSPLRAFRGDGIEVVELFLSRPQSVASMAAVADLDKDGPFEVIDHENGALHAWAAGRQQQQTAGKVSLGAPPELEAFPFKVPAPALSGYVVADIDGDREPDTLFTAEEPLVYAVARTGRHVDGWPKQLPGGSNAHVALGLMDNRVVVAALTRDGRAYIWDVVGTPADIQWDSFHHDPANTGSTGTALPRRVIAGIGSRETPPPPPEGCCSGAPSPFNALGLAALLLSLRLGRRRSNFPLTLPPRDRH